MKYECEQKHWPAHIVNLQIELLLIECQISNDTEHKFALIDNTRQQQKRNAICYNQNDATSAK